ncbi:MAG TPA: XdhC/CoxI family protein [Syntrophales bacterium]|nr:XdhC/CoxI family protein [Syntrophales bacterium]
MNDLAVFEEVVRLSKKNVPFALATVVENNGSSPRKAGAKMLVRTDRSIVGTIGGGAVELEVIDAALTAIKQRKPKTLSLTLTEKYGHVCGGKVLIYIEPLGLMPRLLIFGAGHVGQALAKVAKFAGFRVIMSDERAEYATGSQIMSADEILIGESGKVISALHVNADTCIVIATPGYESDFAAVRAVLKTPAGYIGIIGSKRKREVLMTTLAEEGYSKEDLARLIIPVGLDIGAEGPEEIAISIVSQLIQKRSSDGNKTISDSPGRGAFTADENKEAASSD